MKLTPQVDRHQRVATTLIHAPVTHPHQCAMPRLTHAPGGPAPAGGRHGHRVPGPARHRPGGEAGSNKGGSNRMQARCPRYRHPIPALNYSYVYNSARRGLDVAGTLGTLRCHKSRCLERWTPGGWGRHPAHHEAAPLRDPGPAPPSTHHTLPHSCPYPLPLPSSSASGHWLSTWRLCA